MRVLLHGAGDASFENELESRGFTLGRKGGGTEFLVTLAPPVELAWLAELDQGTWEGTFDAWAREPFLAAQSWLAEAIDRGSGVWVAVTSILGTQPFPGARGWAARSSGQRRRGRLERVDDPAPARCGPRRGRRATWPAGDTR